MNKAKIDEIINLLKVESNEDNAYIGFFLENKPHSESGIETVINANQDGLLLFAQRLISYSQELDSMEELDSIYLGDSHPKWLDLSSKVHFEYLEKSNGSAIEKNNTSSSQVSLKNKIAKYLVGGLLIFLLTMMVYGFVTFVLLFFKK